MSHSAKEQTKLSGVKAPVSKVPCGARLSFCVCQGISLGQTHFITLTLIKNTCPCSWGQSEHKSAQHCARHSLDPASGVKAFAHLTTLLWAA